MRLIIIPDFKLRCKNLILINSFIIRNCSSNSSNKDGSEHNTNHKCNHLKGDNKQKAFLEKLKSNSLYIQAPNTNRKSNKVFKFIQVQSEGDPIDVTDKHELIKDFDLKHNPPGQWYCKNCNQLNFRRRTNCFNCDKGVRESLPIFKLQLQDWICTKCLIYNYQNRKVCDGCKSDKYAYRYTI